MLADFKDALAALDPLSDALDAAIDRRDTADLYALQKEGDLIGFNGGMAIHQAKLMLALLDGPKALQHTSITTRADTLADSIVQLLADERKVQATVKAFGHNDQELRDSMYDSAAESLQNMVSVYRQMRHSGNAGLYPIMVAAYNAAVQNANMGR